MDIYDFINSKDISRYLRENNYEFNSLYSAFIVMQSRRQSIPDRHNALKKIINTMPDMEVPKYKGCKEWNSLKELLNRYIEMQNKYLSLFEKKEANSIYTYNIRYSTVHFDFATLDEIDGRYWINSNIFVPDLDSCKKIAKKEFPKNEGAGFNIGKIYLGNKYYICVEYNNLGQPIQLDIKLPVKDENNGNLSFDTPVIETDDMEIINNPLFFIRYNIPLPFKKGDILCDCFEREPFVLMGMYPWQRKEHITRRKYMDIDDMRVFGYSYDRWYKCLYDEYMTYRLNLEYYKQELKGEKRMIRAYSKFVKGEIDAYTLLQFNRMYKAEAGYELEKNKLESLLNFEC